jgi:hypothetical protein
VGAAVSEKSLPLANKGSEKKRDRDENRSREA